MTDLREDMTDSQSGPSGSANQAKQGTTFETLAVCAFIFGIFAIVAAVFAVGLAARAVETSGGGGGTKASAAAPGAGGAESVEVKMHEFAFDPADFAVAENGKLKLKNTGEVVHNLAIGDVASEMVDPGKEGELDLSGLAPGEYTFICQVAGHEAAGMKGKITVG